MHFIFSISAALFATSLVQSAPTGTALDGATLLANGQDAQKLNSQFLNGTISASDPCNGDETACIDNAIATCVNGRFDVSQGRCSKSQSCFALPNVKKAGTNLVCTSEKSALSLIEATGAKGGITGSDSSSSQNTNSRTSTTVASNDEGMEMGCTDTSVPTASPTVDRVTVTVTLTPTETVTLEPVTTTITPEQASSVLSSILAQGTATLDDSSSSSSVILATPSATADITDIASAAPTTIFLTVGGDASETAIPPSSTLDSAAAAATTILLTVGPDTSETATPSSSTLASAAAAVTSSVDSSASDGGYYGGY